MKFSLLVEGMPGIVEYCPLRVVLLRLVNSGLLQALVRSEVMALLAIEGKQIPGVEAKKGARDAT
jgi:hypothetical protein